MENRAVFFGAFLGASGATLLMFVITWITVPSLQRDTLVLATLTCLMWTGFMGLAAALEQWEEIQRRKRDFKEMEIV